MPTAYVVPPVNLPAGAQDFAITEAMLTETPVAEPDVGEVAWDSDEFYVADDDVISTATHRTYRSLSGERKVVTLNIASPGVVNWQSHGKPAGTPIVLSTTGALPTGLSAATIYYVVSPVENAFSLASTPGGAAINFTGSQSGVHTAIADPNKGNDPETDDGTWWADVGPTNRWRMFDLLRNTATTYTSTEASPEDVVITPGQRVDAIALVGLVADSVTITVTKDGDEVYSYTQQLLTRSILSWYDYFFAPFDQTASVARFDLPPYTSGVVTIRLTRESGPVSCGGVVLGMKIKLGTPEAGTEVDGQNFSRIERDSGGNATLQQLRTIPTIRQRVWCKKADVGRLVKAKADLNAIPAYWSMVDDGTDGFFEAVQFVGIYRRWTLPLDLPEDVPQQLELEEI